MNLPCLAFTPCIYYSIVVNACRIEKHNKHIAKYYIKITLHTTFGMEGIYMYRRYYSER